MPPGNDAPKPASTVLLVRDAPGLEVLMVRRSAGMAFGASAWVFPGGKVAAAGAIVGAVMKATRGQADAARVRELVLAACGQA